MLTLQTKYIATLFFILLHRISNIFIQCDYGRKGRNGQGRGAPECAKTCKSKDLECYVIDNNGFIVVSEQRENTGKFFGEVDGTIFDGLIQHKIFRPIQIYDYQAICLEMADDGSAASMMLTVILII